MELRSEVNDGKREWQILSGELFSDSVHYRAYSIYEVV